MVRWIVDASLRFRRLVVAVAVGVLAFGIAEVADTPVDALPEFNPPMVEVQTEALGLSAEEVEQLITVPLEQDLLVGVPFLDEIESVSLPGLSSVVMTFQPGTDLLDARQVVQERLTQAVGVAGLPQVAKPPQMIQPLSSSSRVAMIQLSSEQLTPIEVSVLARWVIGPRLMSVPGVANVVTWGNRDRQLQVLADPERLHDNGTTLAQVIRTAGNALEVSPLSFLQASSPGTGGFIDTPNQRLNIFHEQAITTADELAQVPLEPNGGAASGDSPLTLGDVTDVVEDHQPLIGSAVCPGGGDCLLLVVEKFPGANTGEVTNGIDDALAALRPGMADIEMDSSVYRPASFVESSFQNLGWALLGGGALLLLLVGAVFRGWRTSLVCVAAMAVSLAAAVLVLRARDMTIDFLVAAGLMIGVTAVIHDAVTDVEGLARRLSRRDQNQPSASVGKLIIDASTEMRSSLTYAVLVVAAAALPLFFVAAEGAVFLPPIAVSYLLAVAASMVVALTLTPALTMMLLRRSTPKHSGSVVAARLRSGFDRFAPGLVTRVGVAAVVTIALAGAGVAMTPFLDTSLRPSLEERTVLVHLEAGPGTSLRKMTTITDEVVEELGSVQGVATVGSHVGRAVMADEIVDVNAGEIWANLTDDADYDETVASIESTVGGRPGISTEVLTYSEERVTAVLGKSSDQVVLRVYGEDPDVLESVATELQDLVDGVDGVTGTTVDRAPEEDTAVVEVDLDKAQSFGVKPGDVRRAAASLLGGITVGNLFDEQKVFDVVVWGAPSIRDGESDIEQLLIDTPDGGQVRLGAVAEVQVTPNPTVIRHESVASYLDVIAQVPGRDIGAVEDDIDEVLDVVEFPLEHHAEIVGGFAEQEADRWEMTVAGIAGVVAIFLLLQAAFGSWRLAVLAFVSLPLALVGGVAVVLAMGGTVTLGAVAGFLALLGITARTVVVLFRRYQRLQRGDAALFGSDAVLEGTRESLVPTVTSVLATALVFAPLAGAADVTGFEILQPMALVVLGGLVTTLVVTLFVLPVFYARYGFVSGDDVWTDDPLADLPDAAPVPAGVGSGISQRIRRATAGIAVTAPALLLSSCGGAVTDAYVVEHEPAKAVPVPGSDIPRVVMEQPAADRLQIQTTEVTESAAGLVVPSEAVFVDTEGTWWVFTNPAPLEFVRRQIGLERKENGKAFLSSGPPAGTEVVTVGVMELYGVEEAVGH